MAAIATVNRYKKSESALRRMRHSIFDYDDTPKEAQAGRVLQYLKARKMRGINAERPAAPRGPYSGLTQRELRATGTCEADWY
jgi:hypothetical protein